jgi:mannose-6-phosphate isomerase-like protein (cupin superfamily)
MVAHREGDGEAEVHETQVDLFVVQSGEATLVVGGEMVGGKTTAPNEIRAPSIKGGFNHALAAGDVVHIPAKIPHQLLVPAGKEFTYFVVKVTRLTGGLMKRKMQDLAGRRAFFASWARPAAGLGAAA